MSCEHCVKELPLLTNPHDFYIHDGSLYHFDTKYGWEGTDINFCPQCGSPLSDPVPLTLDELRERDGRPVWVVEGGNDKDRCGWVLLSWDGDQAGLISLGDEWYPEMAFYGMTELGGGLHVLGWLAYDRPPKEDARA